MKMTDPRLIGWLDKAGPPYLQKAHADGYNVQSGILDHVATSIANALGTTTLLRDGTVERSKYTWKERPSPSAVSQESRAWLFTKADELLGTLPEGSGLEVSRIMRIEIANTTKFTGVVLTLTHPAVAIARYLVVTTEGG
jgi:hypothetical protein